MRAPSARLPSPPAHPYDTLSATIRGVARFGCTTTRKRDTPMGGPVARTHPDVKLADLATRQHGVVSRRQLREIGMSEAAIKHRVAARRLHRMHRGVYAVGHPHLTAHGRYLAAVLACGGGAVLSHRSAADLWELRPSWSRRLDVTVPTLHPRRRRGIAVHATRSLPRAEITVHNGIPCTTRPARLRISRRACPSASCGVRSKGP